MHGRSILLSWLLTTDDHQNWIQNRISLQKKNAVTCVLSKTGRFKDIFFFMVLSRIRRQGLETLASPNGRARMGGGNPTPNYSVNRESISSEGCHINVTLSQKKCVWLYIHCNWKRDNTLAELPIYLTLISSNKISFRKLSRVQPAGWWEYPSCGATVLQPTFQGKSLPKGEESGSLSSRWISERVSNQVS